MVVFVVQRIDRLLYFCVCLVQLLYQAGAAQLDFYFEVLKTGAIFRFDNPMGRVIGVWAKI